MYKSKLFLLFVVVVLAALLAVPLAACRAPAPAPSPAPSPTPTPTPAPAKPAAKPIELKWTTHEPNIPGVSTDVLRNLAKQVAEKTEGRVTIKIFWGAVLGKVTDWLKMVGEGGVAQGGFIIPTYHQWEIPLFAASGLPFFTKGYRVAPKAIWELYKEWPLMQDEMKRAKVKPLGAFQPHAHWVGVKQPFTSIDELKGKKVWAAGFWMELANAFGIVNVAMTAPEVYDALQKGVITGIIGMPYHTFRTFKYYEMTKVLVEWPFGGQPVNFLGVNQDVWDNQISPEDQKTIEKIALDLQFDWFVKAQDEEAAALSKFFKDNGVTEIKLSAEELAKIEKVGKDVIWNSWLKTAKEKGVPGEEWMKRYQEKVNALSK